jgi:two-component system KDP operon response regulator KdpE
LKALIIEDSPEVVEAVSLCLRLRWPEVDISVAHGGGPGQEILKAEAIDIVILDINLPDTDGFDVLKRIRSLSDVPVVILTVRGRDDDQAKGLEMGADDYIAKPFRPRDLVARVNAVLRRSYSPRTEAQPRIVRGSLTLNFTSNEASLNDRVIKLTPTEARLLYILMENTEDTLTSERLTREVWGRELESTDALRTYVKRLRVKLQDSPPRMLLTDHGEGYKFVYPFPAIARAETNAPSAARS